MGEVAKFSELCTAEVQGELKFLCRPGARPIDKYTTLLPTDICEVIIARADILEREPCGPELAGKLMTAMVAAYPRDASSAGDWLKPYSRMVVDILEPLPAYLAPQVIEQATARSKWNLPPRGVVKDIAQELLAWHNAQRSLARRMITEHKRREVEAARDRRIEDDRKRRKLQHEQERN